ncbi:MAG TPA: O-antigen ligase domain-containing protein [Bacteroidetes bacterium]|nr:O-antigen ligase domain-containing protein [Bacteroidota bacterium]
MLIGFSAITVGCLLVGIAGGWYFLAAVPAALLLGYVAVVDFKKVFYLLFALLPFTVEVWLPNGTVMDVPTEPMQVLMMGIYFLYVLRRGREMGSGFIKHPVTLLLLLHLSWLFLTVITSETFIISFKFFLAKIWYVTTFFFVAGTLMKTERDVRTLVWCVMLPLCATILFVLSKHAASGFSFAEVNFAMSPFYRNKVAYACTLTVFLPFAWYARKWYPKWSWKWTVIVAATLLILVGVQFSYTRAAYITLVMAIGAYWVVKWRLMKLALGGAAVLMLLFILNLLHNNNYLDDKPVYEKTITYDKFDDLLDATTKGKDVSTMERVYRWVAGGRMMADKPFFGFGPGTFTKYYKSYTLFGFTTYVSDNEELSGIHCYYLMTGVEQGFVGALLFIALVFFVLLKGEQVYHQTTSPGRRRIVMMAILTSVIIDGLLLMNDLVETDKIGSFFFLCMALIVNADLENRKTRE